MIWTGHRLLALSCVSFALLVCGCKSAPPTPDTVATSTTVPAANTHFDKMTDEQIVQSNQVDGLGLGLKINRTELKAGAQVPIHIAMEDFSARQPIASGMCNGFSLTYDEVSTQDSRTGEITNPKCFTAIPNPDEIPFTKGKIKTVDITQRTASNMDIPPGTYDMTVTWKALPAGKGMILDRPTYTTVKSNPVRITITP